MRSLRNAVAVLLVKGVIAEEQGVAANYNDFKQWMQRYGHSGHDDDVSSFQKYLEFMEYKKTAKEQTPDQAQGYQDYSKYLSGHGGGPVDFQEYMDYDKYMSNHAQYEDFSKYMTMQGGSTPSFDEYLKFQQYTAGQQAPAAPDYEHYLNVPKFTSGGKDVPQDFQHMAEFQHYLKSHGGQTPVSFAAEEANESSKSSHSHHKKAAEEVPKPKAQEPAQSSGYMDYQKYMSGDWSKYMGGSGGSGMGGMDFQQYMDYQKYMQGHASSGGSYQQQYMDYSKYVHGQGHKAMDFKQYMDFQKYMKQSGNSQAGPVSFMDYSQYTGGAADYQKYMDFKKDMDWQQYMNYQQFMSGNGQGSGADYQKYTPSADSAKDKAGAVSFAASDADATQADSKQGGQGNYQQYIPAGYKQYIPGSGGSGGGSDFQQYMDFSKYMGGGAGKQGGAADFSKYMGGSGQAGGSDFQKYMDVQQYMGKYTRNDWMKFQQQQNQAQQQVPYSASDCKTPEELEAWKQRQLDVVNSWVPAAYQKNVLDNVDQEYKKNSERLGMAPPSDSASADSTSGVASASGSKASASVSMQQVEADPDVEKALAKARAALAQSSSVESPKALLETDLKQDSKDDQKTKILQPPLATELAAAAPVEEPTWHPYRALGVVLLGLALPAALALFGLGSRPLSPCVSRRNSEDSITIERYIELDAGDEV